MFSQTTKRITFSFCQMERYNDCFLFLTCETLIKRQTSTFPHIVMSNCIVYFIYDYFIYSLSFISLLNKKEKELSAGIQHMLAFVAVSLGKY